MKTLAAIFLSFILCGCIDQSISTQPSVSNSASLHDVKIVDVILSVPKELTIRPTADENHRIIDNDTNDSDLDRVGEYRIEIFASLSQLCDQNLTGASQMNDLENGKWGKVDYWNDPFLGLPEPRCRPAGGPTGVGYAFCSEKNGKTALVCIPQITDNPSLAKQIFETFRWIK